MIKVFIVDRLNHIGEIPSSRTATCPVGRVRNSSITVHARGKCNFLESIVIRTRIYITPPVERRNRESKGRRELLSRPKRELFARNHPLSNFVAQRTTKNASAVRNRSEIMKYLKTHSRGRLKVNWINNRIRRNRIKQWKKKSKWNRSMIKQDWNNWRTFCKSFRSVVSIAWNFILSGRLGRAEWEGEKKRKLEKNVHETRLRERSKGRKRDASWNFNEPRPLF